jgi:hypothetical protein
MKRAMTHIARLRRLHDADRPYFNDADSWSTNSHLDRTDLRFRGFLRGCQTGDHRKYQGSTITPALQHPIALPTGEILAPSACTLSTMERYFQKHSNPSPPLSKKPRKNKQLPENELQTIDLYANKILN